MRSIFQMFAGYNAWANGRLFAAVADLPDPEYRADHGAFFGSVHGTLNHLLVGDRIWMQRLTGEGEAPTRLDAILYDDLNGLRAARVEEDARIVAFVARLTDADLARKVRYRTISRPAESPLPAHQDHGRCAVPRPDHLSARDRHRSQLSNSWK